MRVKDHLALRTLIEKALNYPSYENSQPFYFKINTLDQFEIHLNLDTFKNFSTFSQVSTWISLGTLLETLHLLALEESLNLFFDFHTGSSLLLKSESGFKKLITVQVESLLSSTPLEVDLELAQNIFQRHTDRRVFKTTPLPDHHITWLTQQASPDQGLMFSYLQRLSLELQDHFLDLEGSAWKDSLVTKNVLKWIRFSKKEAKRQQIEQKIQGSAGFGFLGISRHEPQDLIQLGRSILRMWVYLNSQGYSLQPLSMSTVPAYIQARGLGTDHPLSEDISSRLPEVLRLIQRDTMMPKDFTPIWCFRTGLAHNSTLIKPSQPKTIEDVLLRS